MKDLIVSLKQLKDIGVVGIKQSFEDEGVLYDDVVAMRRITELCSLPLYVKIGGCEAKSDINNCIKLGVDTIIAPMIETEFAMTKYLGTVDDTDTINMMFVCETKTAVENIDLLIGVPLSDKLSGLVFGRSDFTKSLGLNKSEVDCEQINNHVEKTLQRAKTKNLTTTLGGNISVNSTTLIKKLYELNLLDKIETRNVVIKLNDSNICDLTQTIRKVLDFEVNWLEYKSKHYFKVSDDCIHRAGLLKNRK